VLRCGGRPTYRSVHRGCMGRVIEPRKRQLREPTLSAMRKATPADQRNRSGPRVPAGSESGARAQGLPRNLGDLFVSFDHHRVWRSGDPGQAGRELREQWERPAGANETHDEGTGGTRATEADRGRGEVRALHGTKEAGEPVPGDPVEGRRCREHRPAGGKDGRQT
jgi:hypothetical protein